MKVHLVFPVLPPALDGIGDYTSCLCQSLAEKCDVKVLCGQGTFYDIPGAGVEQAFSIEKPSGVQQLQDAVAKDPPDWLILQYNPFSYGRRGYNPYLPFTLRWIKRHLPGTRIALMVHEPFVPIESLKEAIMTTWQRWQLRMLGRQADLIFFSIEPWVRRFRPWFGHKPVYHLPVSSNISREPVSREEARKQLGISENAFVMGVFGSAHPSRLLHFVREAAATVRSVSEEWQLLYIGAAGNRVCTELGDFPVRDAGPLASSAVSMHFAAMDLYLAPFRKGVSSRRGSFMVGLQHGVATLSTSGKQTDMFLLLENGTAFLLAPDDDAGQFGALALELHKDGGRRRQIARRGQSFFESQLAWPRITEMLLKRLSDYDRASGTPKKYGHESLVIHTL